ncbi:MAG: 1,4-alpha-glucan branching enzyme [Candidatus Contendobacter odensis]|uniref:1,4-alpha-glucan branching enzyme GlgB n=1 Tax=Candidatus Contendibacter odensensis TaxID=1400860 RepID=A0A2G6PE47_9GAMM|nr:MAG: 1,4-alpha-glucan branching enzyme [Candidatus Contendobacter odensis]
MSDSEYDNTLLSEGDLLTAATLLRDGHHPDPFAVLGCHRRGDNIAIRAFLPDACQVYLLEGDFLLRRIADTPLFEWTGQGVVLPRHYQMAWIDAEGQEHIIYDPYSFEAQLSRYDLDLFHKGRHLNTYRVLGAHPRIIEGIEGILFAIWAPNAERVSVLGDFNAWHATCHPMRWRDGIWELFIPGAAIGDRYQFELRVRDTGELLRKTDPYGQHFEKRPAVAAIVTSDTPYPWHDQAWMQLQHQRDWNQMPLSIYEVHLGSWQRDKDGGYLNYKELAQRLVAYVSALGFTHIELMPITEHPLDASWGYQPTGYFAPTSRHGNPDDFRQFVDYCHQAGIGVILDWVPGHFPKDKHSLACFDGSFLYEHTDPNRREHRGWGTLTFDYSCTQVKNFLLASACFWLEECHLDGLRVDAVASMLYLDYARESGEWSPNPLGGNENIEAVAFLREMNDVIRRRFPGVLIIAEESTAWPFVTRPSGMGGLGFGMKWNMGWMHDVLEFLTLDPALRNHYHDILTFSLLYAFNENFVLPFSHDEVVHGKGSLLEKMPGDPVQKFANLRLLYVYMWTYPGKKLLFMGSEFSQKNEWDYSGTLDWDLLATPEHAGIHQLVGDLNKLYLAKESLHKCDFSQDGFRWIDCCGASQSVIVYSRHTESQLMIVILNFSAITYRDYQIGVPAPGYYVEVMNSDAPCYGGRGLVNKNIAATPMAYMHQPYSLVVNLPPLTGIILLRFPFNDESCAQD